MPSTFVEVALLSVEEVAVLLGVSRKIVDQHIHSGELVGVRVGSSRKFRVSDIQAFYDRQPNPSVVSFPSTKVRKPAKASSCVEGESDAELDRLLRRRGRLR